VNVEQRKTKGLGEKPVPVPICPPKIPHGLTWAHGHTTYPYKLFTNALPTARVIYDREAMKE
jgi:hypothetical protein